MKNLIHCAFVGLLILLAPCLKAQIKLGNSGDQIKGKIKSMFETTYFIKTINKKKQAVVKSKIRKIYDITGNLIQETVFNPNGTIADRITFTYDKSGNRSSISNLSGTLKATSTISKDKTNNNIYTLTYVSGNKLIVTSNPKKQKIEEVFANDLTKKRLKTKYTYDASGTLLRKNNYLDDKPVSTVFYQYNNKGELIRTTTKNAKGLTIGDETYKYNSSGLKSEITRVGSSKKAVTTTFKYQKFDSKGNWLKSAEFIKGEIIKITDRIVTYY